MINPLYLRPRFILGCGCVRVEDWDGAREALARCVTTDDEDAESWNKITKRGTPSGVRVAGQTSFRISTVHQTSHNDGDDEQEPFSKADRMNYTVVAMDVVEFAEACRALWGWRASTQTCSTAFWTELQ